MTFCSTVSEEAGEDPAGSAWAARRFVLVEIPLPWPDNVLQARHAPEGLEELVWEVYKNVPEPWGFIGLAPDPAYSIEGKSRIFDLQQREGVASRYERDSYLVPTEELTRYLRMLSYEPEHPDIVAARQPDDQITRDFLICTHGAVDACCATVGYPMYKLMRAMADRAEEPVRVWRCTHFGGHRFAATAFEVPDGRYWARLKADMLANLVHRRVPTRQLRDHYRGWAALSQPIWQIAEAEILAVVGWPWMDATITDVTGNATPEDGGTLAISFVHPSTGASNIEVEISLTSTVMTMDATNDQQLREAPQYACRVTTRYPVDVLGQAPSASA